MHERRAGERNIGSIPDCDDAARRARLEADPEQWLLWYLGEGCGMGDAAFTRPFNGDQQLMIRETVRAMRSSGRCAFGMYRGSGKTTIVKGLIIYALVTGLLRFPVAIGNSAKVAQESVLEGVRAEFERNDRLLADYPEVCYPVRALDGGASKARRQTYTNAEGEQVRTDFQWAGDGIVLPTVEGSRCSRAVFRVRGADASIRGLLFESRRPDFVLIDDPDDEQSSDSDRETEKRGRVIRNCLSQLGTRQRPVSGAMLTTPQTESSVSGQFTDPAREPSWGGRRFKLLRKWPTEQHKWETYIRLRQEGQDPNLDTDPGAALQFYKDNRAEMDKGAEVADEHAFDPSRQLSTLQACYDTIADDGLEAFKAECQCEPPDALEIDKDRITAALVRNRLGGFDRMVCPRATQALTVFIDLGMYWCHYAAMSWRGPMIGDVIDYGEQQVHKAKVIGPEPAIEAALDEFADWLAGDPYVTEDGEVRPIDLCMVDAGHWGELTKRWCARRGKPFKASQGVPGQSFRMPSKRTKERRPGRESWYEARQTQGGWAVNFWPDHWKRRVHGGFMAEPFDEAGKLRQRGSLAIFGDDPQPHGDFAKHIVGEEEQTKTTAKGEVREWVKVGPNHWFDAVVGCAVGASVCGIGLDGKAKKKKLVSISDYRRKAKR